MKNILFIILTLAAINCTAQVYVNNIDVNKFDYQYLEMWEHYNKENGKFYALIDYGQMTGNGGNSVNNRVNHLNGGPMEFNSIVAILNFLYKNGWELVTIKTTGEIDSFMMKRMAGHTKSKSKDNNTVESNPSSDQSSAEENNN